MKFLLSPFCKMLVPLLVAWVFSGCAMVDKKMQSWVGMHESTLIQSWGPPQSVSSDGANGKVLVYQGHVNLGQTPGRINYTGYGTYSYTAPQQRGYDRSRMFYVNPKGVIYNYRWQGL